jgi:glycosyltransferase involved in cell wall biosynthesis
MTITVVIPAYNAERFIRDCVESVLSQSRPADEIIVVNDGSTDRTGAILSEFASQVRILDQPNRGRSASRNRAIVEASGDYVAFLDADDVFLASHLATLTEAAERTGHEIVHADIELPYLSERERCAACRRRAANRPFDHFYRFQIAIQAAMIKRRWFVERELWFPDELEIAEDAVLFWTGILCGARLTFVPQAVTRIGIHDANTTRDYVNSYGQALLAYRRLEDFIRTRELDVPRAARRRINRGAVHCEVFHNLLKLHEHPSPPVRRVLGRLLFGRATSMVDRCRCAAAQLWPHFPLARNRSVQRVLFGYTAMRMEQPRGSSL